MQQKFAVFFDNVQIESCINRILIFDPTVVIYRFVLYLEASINNTKIVFYKIVPINNPMNSLHDPDNQSHPHSSNHKIKKKKIPPASVSLLARSNVLSDCMLFDQTGPHFQRLNPAGCRTQASPSPRMTINVPFPGSDVSIFLPLPFQFHIRFLASLHAAEHPRRNLIRHVSHYGGFEWDPSRESRIKLQSSCVVYYYTFVSKK